MSRVSVAEGQKPKPKPAFRFLRKDEGRLSYTEGAMPPTEEKPAARRDSKSLRETIARDMRSGKSHDPFGDVVVAVPKRAPPPRPSETREKAPKRSKSAERRPPWVPPVAPAADLEEEEERDVYEEAQRDESVNQEEEEVVERYRGGTPRSGGSTRAPVGTRNRFNDPVAEPSYTGSGPQRNYFKKEENRYNQVPDRMEDEALMRKLEDEIRAAQEERARYMQSKYSLDRERREFEDYRYQVEQEIEEERNELEALRRKEKKEAQKGVKSIDERYKSVSALLATEREMNRKLSEENDVLRQQLDDLTSTMREKQKLSNTEISRQRREIESLTKRNAELLAMAKEQQLAALAPPPVSERSASSSSSPKGVSPPKTAHSAPPVEKNSPKVELNVEAVQDAPPSSQIVMDFTPRARDEELAEKRSREMELRMKREEEERLAKKKQREKLQEEKRQREAQEAARLEEEREKNEKKKEEEQKRKGEEERKVKKTRSDSATVDISLERKHAGHPPTTPRGAKSTVMKTKPTKGQSKKAIPTKKELIGDEEEIPAEDFPNDAVVSQTTIGENSNKKEVLYRSGKREIHYVNGTVKVLLPSGHTILHFINGDVKRMFPSGKSTYWYDAAQTLHTQKPDGTQVFEFQSTGQVERHHPDGSKEILYPDGIFKTVKADGSEETFFSEKQ